MTWETHTGISSFQHSPLLVWGVLDECPRNSTTYFASRRSPTYSNLRWSAINTVKVRCSFPRLRENLFDCRKASLSNAANFSVSPSSPLSQNSTGIFSGRDASPAHDAKETAKNSADGIPSLANVSIARLRRCIFQCPIRICIVLGQNVLRSKWRPAQTFDEGVILSQLR